MAEMELTMDKKNCYLSSDCAGCPYFITSEGTSCCINTKGEQRVTAETTGFTSFQYHPRTCGIIVIGAGITGVI